MNQYKAAGVDIDAGNLAVEKMKPAIRATYTPQVLAGVGSFGGLFALDDLPAHPVLVASTDGVGTKVKLAAQLGRWDSIGHDIVNHCVNDILVQNARPLFFLDYVASGKLNPEAVAAVVVGIAEACRAAGCALLGGETAEMPDVYVPGAFDLVGTVIGVVSRDAILPRPDAMQSGDVLIGLPSSGPHTNGYTLIRRIISGRDLNEVLADGKSLADAVMAPHRSYLTEINQIQGSGIPLLGMAHITGGGIVENLPRVLPEHLVAKVDSTGWERPAIFDALLRWSQLSQTEAYRVFNMGIGLVVIVSAEQADRLVDLVPAARRIGTLVTRTEGSPSVLVK